MSEAEIQFSIDEINSVSLNTIKEYKNQNEYSNIGFLIISMIGVGSIMLDNELYKKRFSVEQLNAVRINDFGARKL